MALIVADRVQETTNSTGTGAYTLGGAVPGFQTFASEVSNADTVYYSITDNVDFEVGLGTYASSGGTITRTTVFTSSNSNSAVNWGVGTKNIFLTYPADKAVVEDASNNVTIGNNLVVGGTVDGRDVAADGTKLDFVTVTQAVNLDQMETDIAALENGMVYKGDWNAGSGSFPGSGSAQTGWFYYVSGAGTVNGISFTVGDNIVATTDNASTSTYASNWSKHDQTDAVQAVVGLTGSIAKGSLLSALNVEDGADVTDTANVTSAGALMDSEVTNLAQVKAFNSSDYATAAQGTTADNALPKAGGTMSGNIDGNGNKMLFANMYSNLVDLPSATTYHGMFAHVHATGKAYFAHSGAWVPLANESTTLALAGGTMTGDVLYNDNIKAKFGADSDLQIYHNGSNSYIKEGGTGNLNISTDGGELALLTQGGLEYGVRIIQDGAVEIRHDDITKIATTSTGVQVSGNISNATGDFTLDVAGDIILDADGAQLRFYDNGADIGVISNESNNFVIKSQVSDADIVLKGNDGGSTITALTLDMSDGGTASFNSHIRLGDNKTASFGTGLDIEITSDGTNGTIGAPNGNLTLDVAGDINFDADGGDIRFKDGGTEFYKVAKNGDHVQLFSTIQDGDLTFNGFDGASHIVALTLDMSAAGAATFNSTVTANNGINVDNINIDGTTIALSSGDLTIDAANFIKLDADGGRIKFEDNGSNYGTVMGTNGDFLLVSEGSDKDIKFNGNDGGVAITALTLDMSASGDAIFNSDVVMGSTGKLRSDGDTDSYLQFNQANVLRAVIGDSTRMIFSTTETVFNEDSGDFDFRVESNDQTSMLFVDAGNNRIGVGTSSPQCQFHSYTSSGSNALRVSGGGNVNAKVEMGFDDSAGPYIKGGSSLLTSLKFYVDNTSLALTLASNRNATFAQSVTATTFHGDGSNLTGITDTTYSAGSGLDLSGTTFSVGSDVRASANQYFGNSGGEWIYFNNVNDDMRFFVQSGEEMRLESDGDLHVDGNVIAY